ncbi:BLUF domain-containing protein [Constantimarinum furrinae]|uniref:BLUF domain-containing protein n=1 Tax=Constantimarinum furrinae TaxID=2562285 RepID=A0A7G8PRF2_9FLAO|nr:BLUF domain-containing protein [Constantimarinum furrinae]QNJ96918.1 hypothetical protein ALE3EI_0331 [Constantimarinum furrinae]
MSHTICYISKAIDELDESGVKNIFDTTVRNNVRDNISGILLFQEGNFLQVLEGEKNKLKSLFSTIMEDSRHYRILPVINHYNDCRIFESYTSTFSVVRDKQDLMKIKTYLEKHKDNFQYTGNILRLLEPFLL